MKIKHFAGYGSVNAKLLKKKVYQGDVNFDILLIEIEVWGDHECGLVRNDKYDLNQWLIKKVAKVDIDYLQIKKVDFEYLNDIDGQEAIKYSFMCQIA